MSDIGWQNIIRPKQNTANLHSFSASVARVWRYKNVIITITITIVKIESGLGYKSSRVRVQVRVQQKWT